MVTFRNNSNNTRRGGPLEEIPEILSLMVIEINLIIIFQIMKIFKENLQGEIIIMHLN